MPRFPRPGRLLRTLVTGALGVVVIAGIDPIRRPETLTVADLVALAGSLPKSLNPKA